MKKKMTVLLLCLPLLISMTDCMVYASNVSEPSSPVVSYDYEAQMEASGATELWNELPSETQKDLQRLGIEGVTSDALSSLKAEEVVNTLLSVTQREMRTPLTSLGFLLALLLLASFFKGGEDTLDSPLAPTVGSVMAMAVGVTLGAPVFALIGQIGQASQTACSFTQAYGVVLLGILLANGQAVMAASCRSVLFGAVEVCAICVRELILPLLQIFLALSCVSSFSETIRIDAIVRFFEKNAKWMLSFLAVTLTAVLSLSGAIAASADNLAARTARFVIAGSVPVVGGAMGDAYLTIQSGMSLVRGSVGAFGIIAVGCVYLPLMIRTILWRMVIDVGLAVCEVLELHTVDKLMKSLSAVLSLMLGVMIFSLFLLTLGSILAVMQQKL